MALTLGVSWDGKTNRVQLGAGATVGDLKRAVEDACSVAPKRQRMRAGFPPAALDLADEAAALSSLGLRDRDRVMLEQAPEEAPPAGVPGAPRWPFTVLPAGASRRLERLVVPADNSCLFTAIREALQLPSDVTSMDLRKVVQAALQAEPDKYEAFCLALSDKSAADYARWIVQPDSWGGALETQILAEHLGVQICNISIQRAAENPPSPEVPTGDGRLFLLYDDGIHYDVVVSAAEPGAGAPRHSGGCFSVSDDAARAQALAVALDLKNRKQYTDLGGCTLRCMVCDDRFVGVKEAQEHAKLTGHQNIAQIG